VTATSTGVYRVQPAGTQDTGYTNTCAVGERDCPTGEQPSTDLSACVLFNVTGVAVSALRVGNGLLIGQFKLADGRTAVLIQNQNWDMTLWPTFGFRAPVKASQVVEVDPSTGTEVVVMSDLYTGDLINPKTSGLVTLDLNAGEARFLILPK
jgi:hypothetical protein